LDYLSAIVGIATGYSGSGMGMTLWLISMAIFIASSLMGSLNYIVTVINLRTKGMSMTRLPLTIWAFFVTAIIGVSFLLLSAALLLILIEVSVHLSFCLISILLEVLHYQGGSPVLFEHLFWFLGHPEVYIVCCQLWVLHQRLLLQIHVSQSLVIEP
jgi:cytochrome c oxidase subunit 1